VRDCEQSNRSHEHQTATLQARLKELEQTNVR
jgi:hypothetical protein